MKIPTQRIQIQNTTENSWEVITNYLLRAIAIGLLIYVVMQTQSVWRSPTIVVTTPEPGELITAPIIEVSGTSKYVTNVSINGRQIPIDERGGFQTRINPSQGYSIITVIGHDQNKEKSKVIEIPIYSKITALKPTITPTVTTIDQTGTIVLYDILKPSGKTP